MPCGGPSQAFAYANGDKAYKEVIKLLEGKYRLSRKLSYKGCAGFQKGMQKEFLAEKKKLRAALRELIWLDDAAGF